MSSECSAGGFYLRKGAGDRPPVKAGTQQKKKKVTEADKPARRMTRSMTSTGGAVKLKLKNLDPRENIKDIKEVTGTGACEGGAMPTLPLKEMSANQRSRLRNGHPVRVAMGSGAGCCSCKMKEENIKKVMRKKGGAATIKLDADEMRENKISGSGIMSGARKAVKEAKKKVGGAVKVGKAKFGKPSVDRAKKNLGIGGAIGGISLAEAKQALKDGDANVVRNYVEQQQSVAKKLNEKKTPTNADLKAIERIKNEMFSFSKVKTAEKVGDSSFWDSILKFFGDVYASLQEIISSGSSDGEEEGGSLRYGEGGSLGYGMPKRMMGGAIGRTATSSQITNVGAGGNILGPMQASKAPQASSANWFFSTQFPPAMARQITG
jgi:hypothetical protein